MGYSWDDKSEILFQSALNRQVNSIHNFMKNPFDCNSAGVEGAIKQINEVVIDTANNSLKRVNKRKCNKIQKPKNKKWFGSDLGQLKKELKRYGKMLCRNPFDQPVRIKYHSMLKSYKRKCKSEKNKFKAKILNQMEELHTNNPKGYWKLVEELTDKYKAKTNIELDKMYLHYKNLNSNSNYPNPEQDANINIMLEREEKIRLFTPLDFSIKESEVTKAIQSLKNGKAYGEDLIRNEMLKYGQNLLVKPLTKLFNLILCSQYYPSDWCKGRIISIHKKGDASQPENYRGITLTSCLGKLFNSVLNNRLCQFLESNKILRPEQSGFRKNHRTTDHMFVLKNIMDKYKLDRKTLHIAFVDFKQAFDRVRHKDLLYKLLKCGISSKFYGIIKSMYTNIRLSVQSCDGKSMTLYFMSLLGVRQGDNLSPTLFNIFVNDLPSIFDDDCNPARVGNMNINCMMYADDLIIMSESHEGLQESFNRLEKYCKQWGLTLNVSKTKHTPPSKT